MSRWRIPAVVAVIVFLVDGCTTSTLEQSAPVPGQVSRSGRPVIANLKASNNGVFLFYYIPLWSGEFNRPNRQDYELFEDQIKPKFIRRMFDARCAKLKGTAVEDVKISTSSSGAMALWIFWKRSISGEAVVTGR